MFRLLVSALTLIATVSEAAEHPKIGLVLSGGGARGAAHIGVLKELERQRISVDYIAGTSIGAIIGGMYASGMTTEDMEQVLRDTDWDDIFKDQPPRRDSSMRRKFDDRIFQVNKELGIKDGKVKLPSGFIQGQKLQLLLDKLFLPVADIQNFDQLSIPFRPVATDITTSEAVVLDRGSLATAIRASMSVPSVFATVKHQGRILVDGGISNNLPVDVVRKMGADVVIAVDIGTPLLKRDQLESAVGVALQLSNILVRRTTDAQIATLTEQDILITPELNGFSSSNFKDAHTIVPNGVAAARTVSARLQLLAIQPDDYDQYLADKYRTETTPPVISFIRIENNSPLADEFIRSKLHQQLGEPLDFKQLERDIGIIYGLEIFQTVNYRVVHESGETGLVLDVQQKPWGPRYLQFGLRYSSDLVDNNNLGFTLGYTVTPVNIWNGEWRSIAQLGEEPGLATEFNQPLGIGSPYYVNGRLGFSNERFNIFVDGVKISQTRAKKFGLTGAVGREFGHWADLRLGITRFTSENEVQFRSDDLPTEDVEGGEFFARLRFDTLDNAFFPSEGTQGLIGWVGSRSQLGADNDFDQLLLDMSGAASFGIHTVLAGARYFSTIKGEAPIQSGFRLGGLFNLPGFVENELSGQNLYLLRTAYQRRLANLFNTSPYLGVTVQYGQVFRNEDDIKLSDGILAGAVWLGWNSFVGPLYLGYGRADTGDSSAYFIIGNPF
ncbi:MAG: patatin-like phospholipase family protein [Arenicellales bacterium]|nr:patatin-like phospholipase family protein [Arenicellales bacterium]